MVNLVPLSADTAVAEAPPSLYCRALARYAAWLLPQELRLKLAAASTPAPVRPAPHDVPVTSVVPLVPPRQATPQRRDSLPSALIRQFNQPARQTVLTGQMPSPRLAEFRAMEDRAHNAELRAASYLVEVHKKYAIATACIVFVLVGVPVALRFPRGGIGIVVGASVAVFAVYYIGLIAGESLANRLYVPPALAMWSSNIIFTIAGVLGLWWSRTARQRLRLGTWRRASAGAS
jgi:lipopolysaccharide export system permease protein